MRFSFKAAPIHNHHVSGCVYVLLHACTRTETKKKKSPLLPLQFGCVTLLGVADGPRRCLATDVHSPTTIEPARSLRGAGGGRRGPAGGAGPGSAHCDRVLLTAWTASSHFQRALVKSFYGDETAADTCQSQRLPTEHNTWKTQRQRGTGRRRRRRKTCTRVVVNRKSGITAALILKKIFFNGFASKSCSSEMSKRPNEQRRAVK